MALNSEQAPDSAEEPDFRWLPESRTIERDGRPLSFPTRSDYVQRLIERGHLSSEEKLAERPGLVRAIHRHWHGRAQQGCRFATFLSSDPLRFSWGLVVARGGNRGEWSAAEWDEIRDLVTESIGDPAAQAMSLLFPAVTTPEGLVDLMLHFEHFLGWSFLELESPADPEFGPIVALGIRVPLNDDVLAWPLVLGPFRFFALTRDGPITEVALMLKPKVYPLRSQITDDPESAHLADLPVPLDDEAYERMWQNTRRQKALVLGDPAEPRAKAKVSLTLPADLWHRRAVLEARHGPQR